MNKIDLTKIKDQVALNNGFIHWDNVLYLHQTDHDYEPIFKELFNEVILEVSNQVIQHQRNCLLRLDLPWDTDSILKKLIEASEILLHKKNYDGHGYELINHAIYHAKQLRDLIKISESPEIIIQQK